MNTIRYRHHCAIPPLPKGRIQSLEALRGVSALAVTWFHLTQRGELLAPGGGPILKIAAALGSIGYHGVTLFFMLSGFVIPLSMARSNNAKSSTCWDDAIRGLPSFLLPRLIRLQPPFMAACILTLGLNWLSSLIPGFQGNIPLTPAQGVLALLSDSLFLTGLLGGSWILVVAWTLALEVQFYAVAGLVEASTQRWRQEYPKSMMLLGLFTLSLAVWLLPQSTLVFRTLPVFAIGWLLAHEVIHPQGPWNWFGVGWLLLVLTRSQGLHSTGVSALFAGFILLSLFHPSFGPSPVLWLGRISYSLFLVHVPIGGRVVNLAKRFTLNPLDQFLVCLFAVAVSLLSAWFFQKWIEKPFHSLSRRYHS